MDMSEPQWYEALKGNPLKERTFTNDLASKIRIKTASSSDWQKSRLLRQFSKGVLAVSFVAVLLLAGDGQLWRSIADRGLQVIEMTTDSKRAGAEKVNSSVVTDKIPFTSRTLSDAQWQELINLQDDSIDNGMVFKEQVGEDKMLLFSKRMLNQGEFQSATLTVGLYKYEYSAWKHEESLSYHTPPFRNLQKENSGINFGFGKLDTIPILMGAAYDPQIAQVNITSNGENLGTMRLLRESDEIIYWFGTLPQVSKSGVCKVEAVNAEGQVLDSSDFFSR